MGYNVLAEALGAKVPIFIPGNVTATINDFWVLSRDLKDTTTKWDGQKQLTLDEKGHPY
jgi:hypothetical protein